MQDSPGTDGSALAKIREAIRAHGISLSATAEGGIACSPRPPKALEAAIREHRAEILPLIRAETPTPETHPSLPTDPAEIAAPGRSCEAARLLELAKAAGVRLVATPWGWIDYEGPWPSAENHRAVLEYRAELLELLPPADQTTRPFWADPDRNRIGLAALETVTGRRREDLPG